MDLEIGKSSDELNLKARKLTNKFNNSLRLRLRIDLVIDLEIIKEEIEKINNNERLETEKTKVMIKKVLEEFKTEKIDELEWKLKCLTLKWRF